MRGLARFAPLAAVLVAPAVHAAPAVDGAHLEYTRGAGAESCPDESELRAAIAQRLGRDPFGAAGPTVRVSVTGSTNGHDAQIDLFAADGSPRGSRVLTSHSSRCAELAAAIVVSVTVVLDPASLTALSTPRSPTDHPASSTSLPPLRSEPAPASESEHAKPPAPDEAALRFDANASMGLSVASAPSSAVAIVAGTEVRKGFASLGVEGRFDLPASARAEGGAVSVSSVRGNLVPCLHAGWLRVCAAFAIGSLHGRGENVTDPTSTTSLLVAAGARGAVVVPVSKRFDLRAGIDVLGTLRGVRLILDGREAWASPAVSGLFWLGAGVNFP